jgi:hypothetical protein
MRRAWPCLVWLFACALGCATQDPPADDVCQQANDLFARCGVTLPILANTPCTGIVHDVADCITKHASNCDDLASIETKLGECAADAFDGGAFIPNENASAPPVEDDAAPADASSDAVQPSNDSPAREAGTTDHGNEGM